MNQNFIIARSLSTLPPRTRSAPLPLGGGGWGGGAVRFLHRWRHYCLAAPPPSPPLPHKGGGSRPSLPLALIPLYTNALERLTFDRRGRAPPLIISPRQQFFHPSACFAEIDLAGIALLERGHDLAHVLHARGPRRPDDLGHGRLRLRFRHLLGTVRAHDLALAALPRGKLRAAAFVVELDRFLALLDQLLQQATDLFVREHALAAALRLEVGVLERGIDQAQRRDAPLVAGFHCVFQGGVDLLAQPRYGPPPSLAPG